MPHIPLPAGLPGIVGPLTAYAETGARLRALTETILRGPSSLTPAERELIAGYVSRLNDCYFCAQSHASAARHLLGDSGEIVDQVLEEGSGVRLGARMQALLALAAKVQESGRSVLPEDVAHARRSGADDQAIHDTVLIAAAFCMFNRYVDGLATLAPQDPAAYDQMGALLASSGYLQPAPESSG